MKDDAARAENGQYTSLAQLHVRRINLAAVAEVATERDIRIGLGDWVSLPYLAGAGEDSHPRYHTKRLFTLVSIEEVQGSATLESEGRRLDVRLNVPVNLRAGHEEFEVTLAAFSTPARLGQGLTV